MVAVLELWGHLPSAAPEGFSLNKVAGYSGWTMERATISDATIPIWPTASWLGTCPSESLEPRHLRTDSPRAGL